MSVEAWSDNRTARVWYRGAHWQAELAEGHAPHGGEHVITELRGTRLVLTPRNASGGARVPVRRAGQGALRERSVRATNQEEGYTP